MVAAAAAAGADGVARRRERADIRGMTAAAERVARASRRFKGDGSRREDPYSDLPSMTVGLMSVNLATSARTSAIAGLARAALRASSEANWK